MFQSPLKTVLSGWLSSRIVAHMNISSILKTTILTFVKKIHEKDDIYSLVFTPSKHITYMAGQHGIFTAPGVIGLRPLSLSSSPEDKEVIIGTHLRPESKFKQALSALQPGDTITMRGPILNFTLDEHTDDIVLLAQGIGITPFRSILRHIANTNSTVTSSLIHVDKPHHVYGSETKKLATNADYPTTADEFSEILHTTVTLHQTAAYYISGGPKFISETKTTLIHLGIDTSSIKIDKFWGYK